MDELKKYANDIEFGFLVLICFIIIAGSFYTSFLFGCIVFFFWLLSARLGRLLEVLKDKYGEK